MAVVSKPRGIIRRRRRGTGQVLQKATFQVDGSVLQAMKSAVDDGAAPSANAFVEDAIRIKLRKLRRDRLYAEYDRAAADPEFMAEMRETTRVFDVAAGDGLGRDLGG